MTENAKNIYAHWKQKYGATPQAAAGILGVLQLESRLDPKSVNSSSGATGLAQWLGGRKDKLEDLAHKENKSATNLGVQLDYLDQELNIIEVAFHTFRVFNNAATGIARVTITT